MTDIFQQLERQDGRNVPVENESASQPSSDEESEQESTEDSADSLDPPEVLESLFADHPALLDNLQQAAASQDNEEDNAEANVENVDDVAHEEIDEKQAEEEEEEEEDSEEFGERHPFINEDGLFVAENSALRHRMMKAPRYFSIKKDWNLYVEKMYGGKAIWIRPSLDDRADLRLGCKKDEFWKAKLGAIQCKCGYHSQLPMFKCPKTAGIDRFRNHTIPAQSKHMPKYKRMCKYWDPQPSLLKFFKKKTIPVEDELD